MPPLNPVFDAIQDTIIACLEQPNGGCWLPDEFLVTIEDDSFLVFLKGMVDTKDRKPLPQTLKRVSLHIQGYTVIVRSDKDPEPWFAEEGYYGPH